MNKHLKRHLEELKRTGETKFEDWEPDEFNQSYLVDEKVCNLVDMTSLFISSHEDVGKYFAMLYQDDETGADEWLDEIKTELDWYIHDEISILCNDYYGDE